MAVIAEYQVISVPRFAASELDARLYDNLVGQRALWNYLKLQLIREHRVSVELRYSRSMGQTRVSLRLHGDPSDALDRRIEEVAALLPVDFRWRRVVPDQSFDDQQLRMARIVRRIEYIDLPVPSTAAIQRGGAPGRPFLGTVEPPERGAAPMEELRHLPEEDTAAVELLTGRFCLPLPGPIEELRPRQKAMFQELQRLPSAVVSICLHPMSIEDRPECQRLALNWKRFLDPFASELASAGFDAVQQLRTTYDRFALPPGYLVHSSIRVATQRDDTTIGLANIVAASLGGVRAFQVHSPSRRIAGTALFDSARDIPSGMGANALAYLRNSLSRGLEDAQVAVPEDTALLDFMLHTPHLYTLEEADQLAQLPIADDEGLPGFNTDAVPPFTIPSLEFEPVADGAGAMAVPPADRIRIGMVSGGRPAGTQSTDNPFAHRQWHCIDPADLTKHAFIVGSTGSGKTMTTLFLVRELLRNRIPLTIIEPVKTEYFHQLGKLGAANLRRFRFEGDPGGTGPGTAFLVFDPLRVPAGITVARHCSYLKSCFEAAFPMEPIVSMIFENALHDYYLRATDEGACGLKLFTRGGPAIGRIDADGQRKRVFPSYATFKEFVLGPFLQREFAATSPGGNGRSEEFRELFRRRMVNLDKGVIGESFRLADEAYIGSGGKPMYYDMLSANILHGTVVLELDAIPDASQKALVMAFLLTFLFEHRQAEDLIARESGASLPPGLRHFLIVEEAHRLLSAASGQASRGSEIAGESSQARAVGLFIDLLAEIRAYGQGLAIVEQIPTKIASEAVKNTNLKIMLRLTAKDDREYLGQAMNFTDAQMRFVTNLKVEKPPRGEEDSCTWGQINFVVFEEGIEQPLMLSLPLPGQSQSADARARWLYDEFF